MGNLIDTVNYVSSFANQLTNNSNLKKTNLQKNKEEKIKKTFLNTIFDTVQPNNIDELDYEKQLEGLNPTERKKTIDNILASLQDDVHSAGANLAENINTETINNYKKAVKVFVKFAVDNCLDVKTITSGGLNPLKQRTRVIVKIIDEKIEKLTKDLLFNQLTKLAILDRLDEVKGLLVDLTT